jgi:hypothetical protein
MTGRIANRMTAAVGISAVALLGLSVSIHAHPQQQPDQKRQEDQSEKGRQNTNKPPPQGHKQQQRQQPPHLAPQAQQELIQQHEQRSAQYREHLDQQQRLAPARSAQLQQQNRKAQFGAQQQYVVRLRQQQVRIQTRGRYDYGRDPYFYSAPTYRYFYRGRTYETNQSGVNLLRQAVNFGYEEGHRAGMADRQDRWASGYEDSYAYQDANYGYSGFYVAREDYNDYFREGFRRGYEDGYNRRAHYGTYVNGRGTVLGAILATILNFQAIR